jgi:hypothetical protein
MVGVISCSAATTPFNPQQAVWQEKYPLYLHSMLISGDAT